MPIIRHADAPHFALPGLTVRGLAAPSRGASETCVWRIALAPGTPGFLHTVTREEVFVATAGVDEVTLGGEVSERSRDFAIAGAVCARQCLTEF
jgi:hypothetical protein